MSTRQQWAPGVGRLIQPRRTLPRVLCRDYDPISRTSIKLMLNRFVLSSHQTTRKLCHNKVVGAGRGFWPKIGRVSPRQSNVSPRKEGRPPPPQKLGTAYLKGLAANYSKSAC